LFLVQCRRYRRFFLKTSFGFGNPAEGGIPTRFQFGSHKPVCRIDGIELALSKVGVVSRTFQRQLKGSSLPFLLG
jgi:hypothetical protein